MGRALTQNNRFDIIVNGKLYFLNDFRRINVSMSRSRDKLIVFGNKITLSKINMKISSGLDRHYFKDIIEYISSAGKMIRYKEGEIDYGNQSKSGSKLA